MNIFNVLVVVTLFGLLFCSPVVAGDEGSDVLVLTDFNLDSALKEHPQIFVEFYAPWCGHCKSLAPEWEKAATELKGIAVLAKLDAQDNSQAAQTYQIQGFPTLKWFENGQPSEYNGPRDAQGIVAWVKKRIDPIPTVSDAEELKNLAEQHDVVVAANMDSSSEGWSTLKGYALSADDVLFVAVSGAAAASIDADTFLILSKFKETSNFAGSIEDLPKFVEKNAYPLLQRVSQNGQAVFSRLFGSGLPFALVFLNEDSLASFVPDLEVLAAQLEGSFLLAYLTVEDWGQVLPRLGASGNVVPTAIVWETVDEENPKRPLVFDEESEFTISALENWILQAIDGTADSWKQSQPIPAEQSGPVRTVVWKSFEEEITNSGKIVFLEFYSPWCGHCKNLAPAWEQLAESFSSNPDVVIAAYDATANYVPESYQIQGFPTLKLFTPNRDPIDYEGGRDVESLKAFVNQHL